MIRIGRSTWRKVAVCLLAGGVVGAAGAQELQVQFTGTLTAVGGVAGASVGDTVAGSVVIDVGALLPTVITNGSTFSTASLFTPATDPPTAHSTFAISSGAGFATGVAGFNHLAAIDLYRNPVGGYDVYSLSSTDLELPPGLGGASVELSVSDLLGSATAIFPTPPGDLSLLQAVDWFAPGATTEGMFELGDAGGAFAITSLHVGPVAALPEPATLPLLLAGLGCLALVVRRRV
jgi:hypothetical protein